MKKSNFLSDLCVLDLSQFLPGPYATQILADMGADVLKIEPLIGDPILAMGTLSKSTEPKPIYDLINAGKRVIRLDLKSVKGKTALLNFLQYTDILLESYRPGVIERLGFGYKAVQKINPSIIYCSLSGFGQTGPHSLKAGHDINYVAMTGALIVNGPSGHPLPFFPPIADYGGAMQAANSILGALVRRFKTNKGTFIDISLADTILAWQAYGIADSAQFKNNKEEAIDRETGLLNGGAACYNVYQTLDSQFISLGAIEKKFWENFCNRLEKPEWIKRQTDSNPQIELISEVAKVIAQKTRDEWDSLFCHTDCCYYPVLNFEEVLEWPQVQARKVVSSIDGKIEMRCPAWIDGYPPSERSPVKVISAEVALESWKTKY